MTRWEMVHREASGALALFSRRQMDANGVRRVDHTDVTYGFGTRPAKSIFHGANDAAYDDTCTEEEYYRRVGQGVNALTYLPGLGEDGRHSAIVRPSQPDRACRGGGHRDLWLELLV